ncbi:MAG TPA: class I SAM-dependent methyltransferase [Bacteroidales bacterium]|nr:class I SAM-dependent methyltransferase [Bacteroidales bacterium]
MNLDKNQKVWDSPGVVDLYRKRISEGIQKPEAAILKTLGDISETSVLDIGVGTGRTTSFLWNNVRYYQGIDYSAKMIEECKKIFNGKNLNLNQGDVRNLAAFNDASFDICFFSFNGIDYINDFNERTDAMLEISRVLKPGGYFIFSTHIIYNLPVRFKFYHPDENISNTIKCLIRTVIFRSRCLFPKNYEKKNYTLVNDGALRFRLNTFYIKPGFQIGQLFLLGFDQVRVFDLDGRQVNADFERTADSYYLYYSCKKKIK